MQEDVYHRVGIAHWIQSSALGLTISWQGAHS